ncbi:MAG: hypothetical protein HYS18_16355 [Burkholderiales bacterium]|nr:hypothetical protein [Burkholderiales bacterium]
MKWTVVTIVGLHFTGVLALALAIPGAIFLLLSAFIPLVPMLAGAFLLIVWVIYMVGGLLPGRLALPTFMSPEFLFSEFPAVISQAWRDNADIVLALFAMAVVSACGVFLLYRQCWHKVFGSDRHALRRIEKSLLIATAWISFLLPIALWWSGVHAAFGTKEAWLLFVYLAPTPEIGIAIALLLLMGKKKASSRGRVMSWMPAAMLVTGLIAVYCGVQFRMSAGLFIQNTKDFYAALDRRAEVKRFADAAPQRLAEAREQEARQRNQVLCSAGYIGIGVIQSIEPLALNDRMVRCGVGGEFGCDEKQEYKAVVKIDNWLYARRPKPREEIELRRLDYRKPEALYSAIGEQRLIIAYDAPRYGLHDLQIERAYASRSYSIASPEVAENDPWQIDKEVMAACGRLQKNGNQ